MVRTAIVGCGRFAENGHLRHYLTLGERVQLVGFVDLDESRARAFQEKAGTGEVYTDISQLPDSDCLDYVDVCVPHPYHLPVGLALINAGHNVLVEKPMALSTQECDALLRAARHKRAKLGVGMHMRYSAAWIAARDFVRSGRAGRPLYANGLFHSNIEQFHSGGGAREPWRAAPEAGGGAMMDLGIYLADIFAWIFGDPLKVQAMRVPNSPSDPAGGHRGSEMSVLVMAEMPAGVIASIQTTWDFPQVRLPSQFRMGGVCAQIICEDGVLLTPDPVQDYPVTFYARGKETPERIALPTVEPELTQVVDAMERGDDFPLSGREGRRAVAFAEAALDAIEQGIGIRPR